MVLCFEFEEVCRYGRDFQKVDEAALCRSAVLFRLGTAIRHKSVLIAGEIFGLWERVCGSFLDREILERIRLKIVALLIFNMELIRF